MMRSLLIILFMAVMTASAHANLKYYPDPVYQKLNEEDQPPMADVIDLAKGGDVRAQFILGDLYSKGKGGVAKSIPEARKWFEESAIHGYDFSFIRLAALAKHENKPVEAWQWYSLAIKSMDSGDHRRYAQQARHDLTETMSKEDIDKARKAVDDWEDMRDQRLRDERKAAREQQNTANTEAGAAPHEQN